MGSPSAQAGSGAESTESLGETRATTPDSPGCHSRSRQPWAKQTAATARPVGRSAQLEVVRRRLALVMRRGRDPAAAVHAADRRAQLGHLDGLAERQPVLLGAGQRPDDGLACAVPEEVGALGPDQRAGAGSVVADREHQVGPAADDGDGSAAELALHQVGGARRSRRRRRAAVTTRSLP